MTDLDRSERRRAVQEVACGECDAPAGVNCRTTFGSVKYPPHKRRLDNAAQRWREEAKLSEIEKAAGLLLAILRGIDETARVDESPGGGTYEVRIYGAHVGFVGFDNDGRLAEWD